MKFASTRLVAADIKGMVGFYEMVTGQSAEWLAPIFAEIVTPSATLAIGGVEGVALFKEGSAEPGSNRTAILEFMVADVDSEFATVVSKSGSSYRGDVNGGGPELKVSTHNGTLRLRKS